MEGLRTLVICQKVLTKDYFEEWRQRYEDGNTRLDGGKEIVEKCIGDLEATV